MRGVLEIKVPYRPDSVNTHWRRSSRGTYLSKSGREFRDNVQRYMYTVKFKKYTGKIRVWLELSFKDKRQRDIDNYCKSIFDSLNGILWDDDVQIYELHIVKSIGTGEDFFKMKVEEMEEEDGTNCR